MTSAQSLTEVPNVTLTIVAPLRETFCRGVRDAKDAGINRDDRFLDWPR